LCCMRGIEGRVCAVNVNAMLQRMQAVEWTGTEALRATWSRNLLIAGWIQWVVSFFLPVTPSLDSGTARDPVGGWETFRLCLEASGYYSVSAATNFLLLATLFTGLVGGDKFVRFMRVAIAAALLTNLYWMSIIRGGDLLIGYYAWLAAFALVAAGLLLRPFEDK
jgi:hypothetical protein